MPRKRRSRNATESTSKASQDRTDPRDSQAPAGGPAESASSSEETSTVKDETSRGLADNDQKEITITAKDMRDPKEYLEEIKSKIVESSTKAAAVVAKPKKATCPVCDENRYDASLIGDTVKCINCRRGVVLV